MMRLLLVLVLCAAARPALAQGPAAAGSPLAAVGSTRPFYEEVKAYLLRSADQMPEANYAFRPAPEVRTFGQILGHLAGSHEAFCGAALGTPAPESDTYEKLQSKAELVAALRKSFELCDKAYAITDADAAGKVRMFGQDMTRLSTLILNVTHDFEHYGNLITYMRMKGLVPPSSQPRPQT